MTPDRMTADLVSDYTLDELSRQMKGWACEPRQPPRRVFPDGLEISEIAERLGVSESAIKQTLCAIFRKIRRRHPELRHLITN